MIKYEKYFYLIATLICIFSSKVIGQWNRSEYLQYLKYSNPTDSVEALTFTDKTPPLAPYLTLDTLGYDSIQITLDFRGDATLDSFFVRGSDVGYPSSKTSETGILSGAIGDTVNLIHYEYPLAQSSKTYYLRVFVQDTVPNTAYRSVSKADLVPPDTFDTAPIVGLDPEIGITFSWRPSEIDLADVDSLRFDWTWSEYAEVSYWDTYVSIPWSIASVDSDTTISTIRFGYNCVIGEDGCPAQGLFYTNPLTDTSDVLNVSVKLVDNNKNYSNMDSVSTPVSIYREQPLQVTVTGFAEGATQDSIFLVANIRDWEAIRRNTFNLYKAYHNISTINISSEDTTGGVWPVQIGTLELDSTITCVFVSSFLSRGDTIIIGTWNGFANGSYGNPPVILGATSYWVFVDTFVVAYFNSPSSIVADTNGVDSIDVFLGGFDTYTDSTFIYATLTPDASPSKDSMATAIAYTSDADSINSWTFAHGLTDNVTIYIYVAVQNVSEQILWDSTSVIVPDMWNPEAGTLAYFNFVPPYNDSLSIDSSLTADAISFQIQVKKSAKDSWTTLGYLANTDVDSSFYLSGKLSYVGVDTQFLSLTWFDEEENASMSILDTLLPTGSPNSYIYLGTYDSTHTVLDSFKILINDSAISSTADVFVIDASDTITGTSNDTLIVNLPDTLFTQNPDTTYIWSIIVFTAGESPDTSDIATYPERSLPVEDNSPPNIRGTIELTYSPTDSFTITPTGLTSDSADFDRFIFVVYEEDGDSLYYIQYSNPASSYTFNFTNEPANYSWANDSAFAKVYALDEADNRSTAIWDTLVLGWDWIKAVCDTERHALSWFRIYRNPSDSTISGCDSLYQLSMEDVDTTTVDGDTIRIPIPEDLRYAYFNVKGMFSGNWSEGFDAWQYFEEVTIPANFVISAAGDSDTVNVAITKFGSDFVADTARIQYATNGAYPSTRTSGTNLWAGNPSTDSTQINNDNFTINVSDDDTVWARMFLGHKGNNHWNTETKSDTAYFPPLSPPAAGDCTFAWHCESTGDIRNEDPPGYSVGDVTPTVNSGAIITSARYSDGDSCVSIPTSYDRMVFDISSGDIVSADSGTFQCDFMVDDLTTSAEFFYFFNIDADNYFKLIGHASYNDELVLRWEGQNTLTNCTTTAANIQADTWYTLIIKWRIGSVTPNLSITINGHTVEVNSLTPLSTAPTTLNLGQYSGTNHPWFFDNVKIWKYWRD